MVKHNDREAIEGLSEERRQSAGNDFGVAGERRAEAGYAYVHGVAACGAQQEQAPGEELAESRRERRARHTKVECEDEQRVECDVEQSATDDAHHSEAGVALESQLVVERQRRHHKGRGYQYVAQVVAGIWHDVGRSTEKHHELRQQGQSDQCGNDAHQQGGEKTDGGHNLGVVVASRTQRTRDVVARPVAKKESDSLDEGHIGERDADASSSLCRQMPDKSGIDHVIERSDDHTDHRGYGQPQHQPWDWCLRHFNIFGIKGRQGS